MHRQPTVLCRRPLWVRCAGGRPAAHTTQGSDGGQLGSFRAALSARRVLFVAGGSTAGRAPVAAAAALALFRASSGSTLLVDADHPAHGMGDVLGTELPVGEPVELKLFGKVLGSSLSGAQLSGPETQQFLEQLLATNEWRRLLEQDAGVKMAASMGIPIGELLGILDCVRPPPGAEMPVALARLLSGGSSLKAKHVVVDAGAAAIAAQLQSVPRAVADGLEGLLKLQDLVKRARAGASVWPGAVATGLRLLVNKEVREDASAQFSATLQRVKRLHAAMSAMASADTAVLLVLPHSPGKAGERAACRLVDSLRPVGIALTGHAPGGASVAPRPAWLPAGPAVVTLPWGEQRPSGTQELTRLAEAMLEA